jgi:type IV pilus assembly protein PilC
MAHFKVRAATPEGKVVSRELIAASRQDLTNQLEKEGLYLIDVSSRGIGIFTLPLSRRGRVKTWDFLTFNQGLVALLKAGLPVVDCFEALLQRSRNPYFSEAIEDTIHEIRSGQSISEAMKGHPAVFPPLYTASIRAGERTGDLVPAIIGYIDYLKRTEAIRKKMVSAVTYPAVLTSVSFLVIAFLITYVVPSFAAIYLDTGTELPLPTRVLVAVTDFAKQYFGFLLITLAALFFGLKYFLSTGGGRSYLDRVKLVFPRLGEIYSGYSIAKFTRTLSMVLTSGIPLIQALGMAKGVLNNALLESKMDRVIKKAKEGESLTNALQEVGIMPEVTLRMFAVGERSASLPAVLNDIADFHDEEVDHRLKILTDLIEPALMIIMGLLIGTIVVLLYLPIFMLGERI